MIDAEAGVHRQGTRRNRRFVLLLLFLASDLFLFVVVISCKTVAVQYVLFILGTWALPCCRAVSIF